VDILYLDPATRECCNYVNIFVLKLIVLLPMIQGYYHSYCMYYVNTNIILLNCKYKITK